MMGFWFIVLCYEIVVCYVVKVDNLLMWIGVVYGWVYFMYLFLMLNLVVKVCWLFGKIVGVLFVGIILLFGIVVEYF